MLSHKSYIMTVFLKNNDSWRKAGAYLPHQHIQEAEAGVLYIQGQCGLCNMTLSQKTAQNRT